MSAMNAILRSVKSATPIQKVLLGLGAPVVWVFTVVNLWHLLGRTVEDQTGSLVLGVASVVVVVDMFLLALGALFFGGLYLLTRRR
jgi:hypothetical protein